MAERQPEKQTIADEKDDWRVRLHLGKDAKYLYKDPNQIKNGSILAPLVATDGIIFPYTPTISVQYDANYEAYDLTHSNYRGYFYKGSAVQNVIVSATFTANDAAEADYLLASMHFLRSCTRMFYGQDKRNGMPPPLVFLTGFGEYQFDNHPCVLTMVAYNLPNDVDYVPAGKIQNVSDRNYLVKQPSTSAARLQALKQDSTVDNNGIFGKTYEKETYVPTKIDINFTMLPVQTRDQISNEFSLEDYASGKLLKKGFW